jgi:hypothetical protein
LTQQSTPANHYRTLLAQHQLHHDALAGNTSVAMRLLAALAAAIAFFTFRSLHAGGAAWPFLVAFAGIASLVWFLLNRQSRIERQRRVIAYYERAIARAQGIDTQSGRTGLEEGSNLRPPAHLYDRDLDILGPDSLFGLLATVRTGPGERGLARYLLQPATHPETLLRQQAVKELLPQTALREEIALLGATRFHQISASFFDEWLDDAPPTFHPIFRILLWITAGINIAILLLGFTHLATWAQLLPNLAAALAVQGVVCAYLRKRVLPLLQGGARLELNIRLLADGLALIQRTPVACPKLLAIQQAASQPTGAFKTLKQLSSSLSIVEQRTKEYFFILSLLLAAGTQASIAIASWKRTHAASMRLWLSAWAEFEALNAIATYAFEHPADGITHTWPELLPPTHPPLFEASTLAHPLLPEAIPNDIALGHPQTFYLISGSNMSGKSTLLRSIGINAVLAYAGAPVRAASLRLTPLRIGAALALTDSLAEGRSKFLAEVERLASIVTLSSTAPLLFLVDEIFSGTNSADRQTAAAAVLHRLLANQAIGALSTHDLALTDLATPANAGLNVHMASPNPEDPLAFDYKLKPGVNQTTNALAIIRMMGL